MVLLAVLSLGAFSSPAFAKKPKVPKGAVKVAPWNVSSVGKGVWCGKAPGKWRSYVPGKKILVRKGGKTKTYFIPALRQARKSRSASKAKGLKKIHRRYSKRCRKVKPLRFTLKRAVGIARSTRKGSPRSRMRSAPEESPLLAILPSGKLRDAVTSGGGNIRVDRYWSGPNGNLVLYVDPIDLNDTTSASSNEKCVFVEVDRTTGIPSCIDPQITQISNAAGSFGEVVQFDSYGGIYYTGLIGDPRDANAWRSELRKRNPDGKITKLTEGNYIRSFAVLPDSSVLAVGERECGPFYPCSNTPVWLKRFTPPPSSSEIDLLSSSPNVMGTLQGPPIDGLSIFPDGNVYFYSAVSPLDGWGPPQQRILRYLTTEKRLDPKPWISFDPDPAAQWQLSSVCSGDGTDTSSWPCTPFNGAQPQESRLFWGNQITTPERKVFVAARDALYQAAPELSVLRTSTTLPLADNPSGKFCLTSSGEAAIYCGGDLFGQNRRVINKLDLSSGVETTLLGAQLGLNPIRVGVISAGKKVLFVANRNGERVLGQIDLMTGEVSLIREEISDFLVFGPG